MKNKKKYFREGLLRWNKTKNDRSMPWKGEKDPYKIWLSEIILQQTRVDQGLEYYNRFIAAFPTIKDLAKTNETKVFKLWEGLGYYTRCKNLIATARTVASERKGQFPSTYQEILELKGVGPYTAAAIASFAFDLPHAVVDGNVFRVLSRFFGITTPIDSTEGKKIFIVLANELLDPKQPGVYNQALMDFGAVICKPQLPLCGECPLRQGCEAFLKGMVGRLPIKEKTIQKRTRWIYYLQVEHAEKTYVRKRSSKDIWENLYEFIPFESSAAIIMNDPASLPGIKQLLGSRFKVLHISKLYRQQLTHQTIQGQFIRIKLQRPLALDGYKAISGKGLNRLPFPKFISTYLKDKNVSLNLF